MDRYNLNDSTKSDFDDDFGANLSNNNSVLRAVGLWVTLAGVVVIVLSIFLTPWLHFASVSGARQRLTQISSSDLAQYLQRPKVCDVLGIRCPLENYLDRPFSDPDLESTWEFVTERQHLSGWNLITQIPLTARKFKWAIALSLIACFAALLWLVTRCLSLSSPIQSLVAFIKAALALLSIAIMTVMLPTIDTFGTKNKIEVSVFTALAQTRLGIGVWLWYGGLICLMIAAIVNQLEPTRATSTVGDDDELGIHFFK